MTKNLREAYGEIEKAADQIFRHNNGGGYHLCYALRRLAKEIEEINKKLSREEDNKEGNS